MNFSINTDELQKYITIVNSAVKQNNPLVAHRGILFELLDDELILSATNDNYFIKTKIKHNTLNVHETGKALFPGHIIYEIIKNSTSSLINISVIEEKIGNVDYDRANYSINLLSHEDYLKSEVISSGELIKVKKSDLEELINETSYSASSSDNRPILKGVNITVENNNITAVATDSFRLSKKEKNLNENYGKYSFTIESSNLNELIKSLKESEDTVNIVVSDNSVLFSTETIKFQTTVLQGNYPDVNQLINHDMIMNIKFNKAELLKAIDNVALFSSKENSFPTVTIEMRSDMLVEITSQSKELGKAKEEVYPLDASNSKPIKISFNARFVTEALKKYKTSEIIMNMNGNIKPFTITSEKQEGSLQLILPLRTE